MSALQDAEAQQDGNRAHVGDQQVKKTRPAYFGHAMVAGDEKIRRQRHRFPGHHEQIRIIGDQHRRHGGKEHVVLHAKQARRRALAGTKITGRKDRDAHRHRAEQDEENRRQRVDPDMERQIGQPDRQDHGGWLRRQRRHAGCGEHGTADRTQREQDAGDPEEILRRGQPGQPQHQPLQDRGESQDQDGRGMKQGHDRKRRASRAAQLPRMARPVDAGLTPPNRPGSERNELTGRT